jgi:hypothetical protein
MHSDSARRPADANWRLLALIAGIIAVAVVVGSVVLIVTTRPAAAQYQLEPVGTSAVPAFTPPVGRDQRNVVTPVDAGQVFQGDTPGLYAGTPDVPSCDRQALLGQLQADQQKAAVWSEIQGIQPTQLSTYIGQLTSVVLRSDTYVANYGYEGQAVSSLSVLQAGTAVFVDKRGVPVVKCTCGNPVKVIQPPAGDKAGFIGTTWPGFSAAAITVIQPIQVTINQITIVNVQIVNNIHIELEDNDVAITRLLGGPAAEADEIGPLPGESAMTEGPPAGAITAPPTEVTESPTATLTEPPTETPTTPNETTPAPTVPTQPPTEPTPTTPSETTAAPNQQAQPPTVPTQPPTEPTPTTPCPTTPEPTEPAEPTPTPTPEPTPTTPCPTTPEPTEPTPSPTESPTVPATPGETP